MSTPQRILQSKFWWLWLLLLFVIIIYAASLSHTRIDLTKEKRFSLSNSTKRLLGSLDSTVQIDVYLTGELSAGFKKLSVASEELLSEFKERSGNNVQYRFINIEDSVPRNLRSTKNEALKRMADSIRYTIYDSLRQLGLRPFRNEIESGEQKTERIIFPGAFVRYKNRRIPVDLFSGKSGMDEESTLNYSEALLEFKFADAIDKLTRKRIPIVAYATGNGEPEPPTGLAVKDLFNTMSRNYVFGIINLETGRLDADTVDALLIVKPSGKFTEVEKLKLDQYIMHGGKVLWFIDKLYAEYDSLQRVQSEFVAFDKNLDLDDILFKYGVRINSDLLQDLNCARQVMVVNQMGNQPQVVPKPFFYYPLLSSPSTHPISKNLDYVLSTFPSTVDTVKAPGINKTILLATDSSSRTLSTPAIVSLKEGTEGDPRSFQKKYLPVAVLLDGKFTSLFANRLTSDLQDSLKAFNITFAPGSARETKQVVVSDADIVTGIVSKIEGALPMGMQQFDNYQYANKEFFLNAVDYLVNPSGVLETRSKDVTLRLLDKQKVAAEKSTWQLLNIALPMLLVLLFGGIYQQVRKRKFAA